MFRSAVSSRRVRHRLSDDFLWHGFSTRALCTKHGLKTRATRMRFALSIFALAFATPMFALAGLALAAIPIIIHFLNRRRFKTVPWAAMEFLLRAMRKNRRRLRFEQWILLATRCAVIMLAALALARP